MAHSSGGLVAAHFADLHPEGVSALVLLAAMGAPFPRPLSSVMCVFGLCLVLPFLGKCFARSLHGAYCSGHRKTARERGDPQDGERMISYFRIQAARPEYDRTQRQIISDGWAAPDPPPSQNTVDASRVLYHCLGDLRSLCVLALVDSRHATSLISRTWRKRRRSGAPR